MYNNLKKTGLYKLSTYFFLNLTTTTTTTTTITTLYYSVLHKYTHILRKDEHATRRRSRVFSFLATKVCVPIVDIFFHHHSIPSIYPESPGGLFFTHILFYTKSLLAIHAVLNFFTSAPLT